MAGHADLGAAKAWPDIRKNVTHAVNATALVQATMTTGGISRARPLITANWVACVPAAASDSANQLTGSGRAPA